MIRNLSNLAWLCWLILTGLFVMVCFQDMLFPRPNNDRLSVAWCGTPDPPALNEDLRLGKTIFRNNCASCHAGDMKTDLTGPALGGMRDRWADHGGDKALYAWIRNSQGMIAADTNARAQELWLLWGPTVMNSFQNLTDEEMKAVIEYVEADYFMSMKSVVVGCP